MNKVLNINSGKTEKLEQLRYESYLNSIEAAFINHKSGIRLTDKILLDFADTVIKKFASIKQTPIYLKNSTKLNYSK